MPKHKSEDLKLQAVRYYLENDKHQQKTCKIFGCSERSLMRWVQKYQLTKQIKRKKRTYVAYKVKKTYVNFIKESLIKDRTLTIKDLTDKLNTKFKVKLSQQHIAQVVRDNNITLKRLRLRHEPVLRYKKPIDINKQLKAFYDVIKKTNIDDIISIDETSLNAYEVRKYCYSKLGKRCVVKTTSQQVFKKYTGIFAITTKGCIGYEIYDKGGIDTERLLKFLKKYVTTKYTKKTIILDNASSHRTSKVKELITKKNKLLYSVPYQHYTNAIENYFSVLKSKLRKLKGVGLPVLKFNVSQLVSKIPKNTYKQIFKGSYERERKYIPKKSKKERKLKTYK